jgi:hypothetical protein
MTLKRRLESRIHGWFPQEPLSKNLATCNSTQPQTKTAQGKKAFIVASIANAVLLNVFLGTNFLILRPFYHYYMSLELSLLSYGIFVAAVVGVNVVIYRHYHVRLLPKGGFRWG